MRLIIRPFSENDLTQILNLIKQLAVFEKQPNAVELSLHDLKTYGFGPKKLFNCFVAVQNNTVVGMALFYYRFSTWKGKTIHLEDLIVDTNHRQKGIGSKLYRAVIRYAKKENLKRVEWVVLDWNTPAIDFYKKSGAHVFSEWKTVQMEFDSIEKYLAQHENI